MNNNTGHQQSVNGGGWSSTPMNMSQGNVHQYTHKHDDIPLGKISMDEEDKYQHVYMEDNKRISTNSIYQIKQSKISLFAKPIFSIVITAFLSTALLLLFLHADGKPLDYTIIGLKIPSLVSLILSVNLIFIASGISTAIAEYKWVQLQNGARLSLIDIYDSCTRGLSGFFMTFRSMHFDMVLIVALIFHLSLLAVSPASQAILVPYASNYNITDGSVKFFYYQANYTSGRNNLKLSGQAPMINGLTNNTYLTSTSFAQAAVGSIPAPNFICPDNSSSCVFSNVSYISTSVTCKPITGRDTAIVNRSGTNRTVVVLDEYLTGLNISAVNMQFPKFLYSTEMFGRTYYDLANYTRPIMPGLNISLDQASDTVYDPQYRPYVGDQIVVVAYNAKKPELNADNYTQLAYKKCSFTSSLNTSVWQTSKGTLQKVGIDLSEPIVFDYDNILGNNVALRVTNNTKTNIMINAYVMQQAILYELTTPKYYLMRDYLLSYSRYIKAFTDFEDFMSVALPAFDFAFFQAPFVSFGYAGLSSMPHLGFAYFNLQPTYKVNKVDSYILCLCLLLPIFWWLAVWLISLKKNGGVARGSSQIALLTTAMTPAAAHSLRGFSNLDSSNAFKRGQSMRIKLGIQKNRVAFGMEDENDLQPLKN